MSFELITFIENLCDNVRGSAQYMRSKQKLAEWHTNSLFRAWSTTAPCELNELTGTDARSRSLVKQAFPNLPAIQHPIRQFVASVPTEDSPHLPTAKRSDSTSAARNGRVSVRRLEDIIEALGQPVGRPQAQHENLYP